MHLTIAATGHRPNKLTHAGQAYNHDTWHQLTRIARAYLTLHQPATLITGMALGWDTIAAETALDLGIPIVAAIPFHSQTRHWQAADIAVWKRIRDQAAQVHYMVPPGTPYSPSLFQLRNQFMVDRAQRIMALWNGSNGGTANCLQYATSQGKLIDNLWPSFAATEG